MGLVFLKLMLRTRANYATGMETQVVLDGCMKKVWGLLTTASFVLVGCSGADTATSVPADSPSSETTAKGGVGESICDDVIGDSSGIVDLEQVQLVSDGTLMFLTFDAVSDVPTTGTALYSATAWSEDGETGYQIGVKFEDGQEIANFVYNLTDYTQKNLTNAAVTADSRVSVRYPLSELEGLGETFSWSATVTVDGTDVDRCPDGEGKQRFPDA